MRLIEDKAQTLSVPCTGLQLKTWLESIRTLAGKLIKQGPSGTAKKNPTEKEKWIIANFGFLEQHISRVPSRQAVNLKKKIAKTKKQLPNFDDSSCGGQPDSGPEELEEVEEVDVEPSPVFPATTEGGPFKKRKNTGDHSSATSSKLADIVQTAQQTAARIDQHMKAIAQPPPPPPADLKTQRIR